MENKTIAIIPARGGSKRIPKKNIKLFKGKPIIQYSLEAAIQSKCFNEIMVSTDDNEIAKVSTELGVKVPFFRSLKTSDDFTGLAEVLEEVILKYKNRGKDFDLVCCILPTAPFISVEKIKEGLELLLNKNADSVMTIVRFGYPIQRALKMEDGLIKMFNPENYKFRSQDLLPAYHDAGLFYWMRIDKFLKNKKIFTDNTIGLEIPEFQAQDIDTIEDWEIAERKYDIVRERDKGEKNE